MDNTLFPTVIIAYILMLAASIASLFACVCGCRRLRSSNGGGVVIPSGRIEEAKV